MTNLEDAPPVQSCYLRAADVLTDPARVHMSAYVEVAELLRHAAVLAEMPPGGTGPEWREHMLEHCHHIAAAVLAAARVADSRA